MAAADVISLRDQLTSHFALFALGSVLIGLLTFAFQSRVVIPDKVPKVIRGWPLIGNYGFWSARLDFHRQYARTTQTGRFSYFVGQKPVVALKGPEDRKLMFESKDLDFTKGYSGLLAGGPQTATTSSDELEGNFPKFFAKRLLALIKREQLAKGLPNLMQDTRDHFERLLKQSEKLTDPFDSIYRLIFQLTMRTVAAKEIAEDAALCDRVLSLFEMVESSSTPTGVMYPYLLTPATLKRMYAATKLYTIFDRIVKDRRKAGRREDDPLQYLMDQGDSTMQIITFVITALFAAQFNSGVNAAWIMTFLADSPKWRQACREEVLSVAAKYVPDTAKPLADRLANLPLEAFENDFPIADACLRESIRLNTLGSVFRKNIADGPVRVGDEIVPCNWYTSYPVADIHLDPTFYPDPEVWQPERWINPDGSPATGPDSAAERHKDQVYPFIGWGVARHPCLGVRFAKLEQNVVVAFSMACMDWELADKEKGLPKIDNNAYSAAKPKEQVKFRYWAN